MKFYVDCFLDQGKKELVYQMSHYRGKVVGTLRYGRDHIIEKKNLCVRILEWMRTQEKGGDLTLRFRNTLKQEERNFVQTIFPYIPVYRNLWDFLHLYEQYNAAVDYDRYECWKAFGQEVLQEPNGAFDGAWKCIHIGKGAAALCCKWQDISGKHVVIADEQMFYSDVTFDELCSKEVCFEGCSALDLEQFMADHPDSMTDVYLVHGGRRLLYFLTSSRADHSFELLAKAGLSKLADNMKGYRGLDRRGKNIQAVMQLPVRCLRTFCFDNDMMLYDQEDRAVIQWAYEKCPDLFEGPFTVTQELWFRYCFQFRDLEIAEGVYLEDVMRQSTRYLMRKTKQLGNPYQVFGLYENYLRCSLRMGMFFFGLYPKDLEEAVDMCDEYLQKQYEERKAQMFVQAVQREEYRALEENLDEEPYQISVPQNPEQLVAAGAILCNCLKSYVSKIKTQQTMVGLIYEKEHHTLEGAIEIKNGILVQAKGYCNGRLKLPVEAYLSRYLQRKAIA